MAIRFEQHTLPVLATCDVVIAGGSFGGIAAAIHFAGAGYRVTVVEPRTYLGREVTATLRPWLLPQNEARQPDLIASAVKAAQRSANANMDALKLHLEDRLLDAGVKLLYASTVVGVHQTGYGLQGVVVGNKSGRQVILCRLLLDASETALVARLLGEPFAAIPTEPVVYQRTLEFDGVGSSLNLAEPLVVDGQQTLLHPGYRGKDHVYVEYKLRLPFCYKDAFDMAQRETAARHETMAFVSVLAKRIPAFESAYLSGASYELAGPHTPVLCQTAPPDWAEALQSRQLFDGTANACPLVTFAGAIRGVWYLNEAVPGQQSIDDPVVASRTGAALAQALYDQWPVTAAPASRTEERAPALAPEQTVPPTLLVREPYSPQRGRPYPRVADESPDVPVLRKADVLVVGGGSSGATAALTAGREGLRTVLIEMNPGLGGTGTFGGVHSYWFGRRVGFSERLMKLVDDMHIYLHHPQPKGLIPKWNIEAKSYALLKEADDCGVEILFNSYVIGTLVDGNQVCGVVVATRMGIGVVRARVVIDASGDGDVAAFAGADYVYGNERDHITMWYALAQFPRPGLTRNHFTSMVDVSNIEDYTRAILAGRRRGSKNGAKDEMHDHGIYVAPRESRHIKADYVLTLTDQLRQRRWDDVINITFSNHDVKGHSGSDWLRIGLIPPNLEVEIPYRALLPSKLDNILVVGKAISATHDALPAIRMQADLENLGGVAALAAAQALRDHTGLREINLRGLQARLVAEGVLPASVLTRSLQEREYSDVELQQMIDSLPTFPLREYSDMALTDIYTGIIPLVEICCAGPQVVPLLEEAHAETEVEGESERRLLLAQMLALVGSSAGVPALIEAIAPYLEGDGLPPRTAHIRYTQLPPDHGAMPEAVYLLYSLGMTPDDRALPLWQRVVDLLATVSEDDFYDEMKGVFYYVDAVCYGAERLATPEMISLLIKLHSYAPFHNRMEYRDFQPDYIQERLAYLELVIGRALARSGSAEGLITLISYLGDSRALLAEHAHTELVAITGVDCGKDIAEWSRWLEFHGDSPTPKPWRAPTEPMQAWRETMLTVGG